MLHAIAKLTGLLKRDDVNLDFLSIKIVQKTLLATLLLFCLHSVYKTYHGSPLLCYTSTLKLPDNIINSKCLISGTYTLPQQKFAFNMTEEIFPGIRSRVQPDPERSLHILHQYIWVYFGVCAAITYFPCWWWRYIQGSFIEDLIAYLHSKALREEERKKDFDRGVQIFRESIGSHSKYSNSFVLLLFYQVIILLVQLLFIFNAVNIDDWMFGYHVYKHATIEYEKWPHHLATIFPRVSACDLAMYGPSGSITLSSALCFSDTAFTNILMIATQWWLVLCSLPLVILILFWHLADMCCPPVRYFWVINVVNVHPKSKAGKVLREMGHGTSFMILLVAKNLPAYKVCDLLNAMHFEFKHRKSEINRRIRGFNE